MSFSVIFFKRWTLSPSFHELLSLEAWFLPLNFLPLYSLLALPPNNIQRTIFNASISHVYSLAKCSFRKIFNTNWFQKTFFNFLNHKAYFWKIFFFKKWTLSSLETKKEPMSKICILNQLQFYKFSVNKFISRWSRPHSNKMI